MRVLTNLGRGSLLATLSVALLTLAVTQSMAHPPEEPDHGINETAFYTLWAGDDDITNVTALEERLGENATGIEELAALSDIPLNEPPEAVEQWNQADHREFPETDSTQSIHPTDATLRDGAFVADAYASIFAVQPSTHARLAADESPLYVAPDGTLLGTVDYRVVIPESTESANRTVRWRLGDHQISETRLLIDGELETRAEGSHTPTLSYAALNQYRGSEQTLTLGADITVRLQKTVRECTAWSNTSDGSSNSSTASSGNETTSPTCSKWNQTVTNPTESLTVSDTLDVSVYTLTVSGYQTHYPDGEFGLTVYKNQPWLGYTAPDGAVRGVWRFYSARDTDWDTLITSTDAGSSSAHSPVHPLQVHAYPIEAGPTPEPRATVTLLATYGKETQPPTLPSTVSLDVMSEAYTASYGLAVRVQTDEYDVRRVTAHGLVRGVERDLSPSSFVEVPFHESNLSVTVLNSTAETTTLELSLRTVDDGAPIKTQGREGVIYVDGKQVNTGTDGTATVTLGETNGVFTARYEPAQWWLEYPAYLGDSTVVYTGGSTLHIISILYQTGVPIGLFLFAVFIIDRITGWDIWPPWGRR